MKITKGTVFGAIKYIDNYGNLVTNISREMLEGQSWSVMVNNIKINSHFTYSTVEQSKLLVLIGSHGYLEIAVNGGNAKIVLDKNYGDLIKVTLNQL